MADDDARARRTRKAAAGAPAKKAGATKAAPKKAAPKKAAPKKAAPKKAAPTKATARKTAVGKAPAKKTTAEKTSARRTSAEKAQAGKAPVRKAAPRKAAAKKAPAEKAARRPAASKRGAVLAGREKKAPPLRLAAERTFDDDWDQPAPEAPGEDPSARRRALLRATAARLEGREPPVAPPPPPAQAPPPPRVEAPPSASGDEPVPEVLVSPTRSRPVIEEAPADDEAEEYEEGYVVEEQVVEEQVVDEEVVEEQVVGEEVVDEEDEIVEDEVDEDEVEEDDDWSPPEILDAPPRPAPPPPPPPRPTPPPPPPPARAEPATAQVTTTPAPPAPRPAEEEGKKAGGSGPSIVAIVLALVLPVVGAIIGFVLARRARREGRPLAGLAKVVSIVALVGWLLGGGVGAFLVFGDQGVDYSKLQVGDCFDSSDTSEVRGVKVKPCTEPHDSEIFFVLSHPAGPEEPYPGKDALVQYAADACLGAPLTEYLGVPLEQSQLRDFEIVPQESAWNDGRRVLVCGVDTGGQGQITESVRGTGR